MLRQSRGNWTPLEPFLAGLPDLPTEIAELLAAAYLREPCGKNLAGDELMTF
jgi:hypothetical protein